MCHCQAMSDGLAAMRAMAEAGGRDPSEVHLVVRANLHLTEQPLGPDRFVFTGSLQEIAEDVHASRDLGATELFFDLTFTTGGATLDSLFEHMERLFEMAQSRVPAVA